MAKKTVKKVVKKTVKKKVSVKKAAPVKKKVATVKKKVATSEIKKKVKKKVATEAKKDDVPVKKKKVAKARTRTAKVIRLKAFWGVFNQSLRRVALFEFNERKKADEKAEDLTKNGKSPHFVMPVKEAIQG
jgi:hypothetical protein